MKIRNSGLSLVGRTLLCGSLAFNFLAAEAWNKDNHMDYVGLKIRQNDIFYKEQKLRTIKGESLANSFDNCSKIIEAVWNNKNKNFTDWIKTDSLKGRLENDGALQNGLVLLYSAWVNFNKQQTDLTDKTVTELIAKCSKIFNFKAVETLASDIDWYLNNEKWNAAYWIQRVRADKGCDYQISYSDWKENKYDKNIIHKNIEFGKDDMKKYLFDQKENIKLEEGITSIGNYCFGGCSNLSTISLPPNIKTIKNIALIGVLN